MTSVDVVLRGYSGGMSTEQNEHVEPGVQQASEPEVGEISEESLDAVSGGWPADGGVLNFTFN